jgi:hypothetical protein
MKTKPELEVLYEIWTNDGDGWRFEVGPDRDGLGCVELRYVEDNPRKIVSRVTMDPHSAELVGQAILRCSKDLLAKEIC